MTQRHPIDITASQRRLVLNLLHAYLPTGAAVWVFGSRATGQARRYSDLDLAIDAGRALTLDETATLAEAFSDSDLPYRIDLVDWQAIDERFARIIAAGRVPLDAEVRSDPGRSREPWVRQRAPPGHRFSPVS